MKRKLSKTILALVFFTLTLILSIAGMLVLGSIYHPTYSIYAQKINYTPERYVLLENPDSYTLEAINNGWSKAFLSWGATNFDEKYYQTYDKFNTNSSYSPFYFEYNNSYYGMSLVFGDNFPPYMLPQIIFAGIIVSIGAIVIIGSYKTVKYVRK